MEKIITTIVTQLLSKLTKDRKYYTQKDLSDYGYPQFLIKRITFHLVRELSKEFNLPGEEWLKNESDELLAEWAELQRTIKREIRLPAFLAEEIVGKSVRECVGMTIQPRKVIPELLFDNRIEMDSIQLTERSSAITVNRFLVWSMIRYMEKKNRESLNISDATRIIESIESKIVESYHPLNWLSLVKPLYELSGSTVHSDLFRRFFEDKDKNHLAREFDLINDEIKESRFVEILSSPKSIHVEGYEDDQQNLFQEERKTDKFKALKPNDDLIGKQDKSIEDASDSIPIFQSFREDPVEESDEWEEADDEEKITNQEVAEEENVTSLEEADDEEKVASLEEADDEEQVTSLEEDDDEEQVTSLEEADDEEKVASLEEADDEEKVASLEEADDEEQVASLKEADDGEKITNQEEDDDEEKVTSLEEDDDEEKVTSLEEADDDEEEKVAELGESDEKEKVVNLETDEEKKLVSKPKADEVNVDIQDEELRAPWEEEDEDSFRFITHHDNDDSPVTELKDLFNEEQEAVDGADEQEEIIEEDEQNGVIDNFSDTFKKDDPTPDASLLEIDDEVVSESDSEMDEEALYNRFKLIRDQNESIPESDEDDEDDEEVTDPVDESEAAILEVDSGPDADSDDENSSLLNRFMFDDSDKEDTLSSKESDADKKVTTIYDELNLVRNNAEPETMDLFGAFKKPEIEENTLLIDPVDESSALEKEESKTIRKFSDIEESESEEDSNDKEVPMWRSFLERDENETKSAFQFDDKSNDFVEGPDFEDSDEKLDEDGFIEEPIYDFTQKEPDIDEKIGDLSNWIKDVREKFIEDLFGDSEDAYEQALADIMEFDDWKNASKYIEKEIFTRNRIDVYDEIAVDFTDRLHSYFIENKS